MKKLIVIVSILLAGCGGGGSGTAGNSKVVSPQMAIKAGTQYVFGTNDSSGAPIPIECQTQSILESNQALVNSWATPSSADYAGRVTTGNDNHPTPSGMYLTYCRMKVMGYIKGTDFTANKPIINITSYRYFDQGYIGFDTMKCQNQGDQTFLTTTYGKNLPIAGQPNLQYGMYNGVGSYTDSNGNSVPIITEYGNGTGPEFNGIGLLPNNPYIGQVINSSSYGIKSCTDSTPANYPQANWQLSVAGTVDPFGTSINSTWITTLWEKYWGSVINYVFEQDVGMADAIAINFAVDADKNPIMDSNGNVQGTGYLYYVQEHKLFSSCTQNCQPFIGWDANN